MEWARYRTPSYDELIDAEGRPRPAARPLVEYLSGLTGRELAERDTGDDAQQYPHAQVALEDAHGRGGRRAADGFSSGIHGQQDDALESLTSQVPPWQQCSVR